MCTVLQKLGICLKLAQYGAALFKPLSYDIVTEGVRKLETGGSPGVDGIPAKLFKAFPDIMVPQMLPCIKGAPQAHCARRARAVQLFGRLAVLETHTLRY